MAQDEDDLDLEAWLASSRKGQATLRRAYSEAIAPAESAPLVAA